MKALKCLNGTIDLRIYRKKKADWKKDVETMERIVELYKTLHVGNVTLSKGSAISELVKWLKWPGTMIF